MWLLDNNIPRKIHEFLKSEGIKNETAAFRNWESLRNGDLVEIAHQSGFKCILTQDVDFIKSAAKNLSRFPEMSIVLVQIKQEKGYRYLNQFMDAWKQNPIHPIPGQLLKWP